MQSPILGQLSDEVQASPHCGKADSKVEIEALTRLRYAKNDTMNFAMISVFITIN